MKVKFRKESCQIKWTDETDTKGKSFFDEPESQSRIAEIDHLESQCYKRLISQQSVSYTKRPGITDLQFT